MGKVSTQDLNFIDKFKDLENGDNEGNNEDSKGNTVNTKTTRKTPKTSPKKQDKEVLKLIGTRLPVDIDNYLEYLVFTKKVSKQDLIERMIISGVASELKCPDNKEDVLKKIHQELKR